MSLDLVSLDLYRMGKWLSRSAIYNIYGLA